MVQEKYLLAEQKVTTLTQSNTAFDLQLSQMNKINQDVNKESKQLKTATKEKKTITTKI